jgi:hypothetical protein
MLAYNLRLPLEVLPRFLLTYVKPRPPFLSVG